MAKLRIQTLIDPCPTSSTLIPGTEISLYICPLVQVVPFYKCSISINVELFVYIYIFFSEANFTHL